MKFQERPAQFLATKLGQLLKIQAPCWTPLYVQLSWDGGWATSKMDTSSAVCSFFSTKTVHKRFRPPPTLDGGRENIKAKQKLVFLLLFTRRKFNLSTLVYQKVSVFSIILILALQIICVVFYSRFRFRSNPAQKM